MRKSNELYEKTEIYCQKLLHIREIFSINLNIHLTTGYPFSVDPNASLYASNVKSKADSQSNVNSSLSSALCCDDGCVTQVPVVATVNERTDGRRQFVPGPH